jgi:tetratricopeptide (TPR) repeat protein
MQIPFFLCRGFSSCISPAIFYGRSAIQFMSSRARVGIFFGTGLFACVWLVCSAPKVQSEDSAPPIATDKTNLETGPLLPPNFLEQQDIVQQAIEQSRREADAAVKRNADTLAARLDLIELALAQQHKRELEAMQNSNRTTLIVAGILAGTGFLGMFGLAFFVMRASNRLTELSMAVVPQSHAFGPGPGPKALALGDAHLAAADPADPADRAGTRLLGAIEQLEKRLCELEQTTQPTPSASAATDSGGLPTTGTEHAARLGRAQPVAQTSGQPAAENPAADAEQASRIVLLLAKGQTLLNLDQPAEALACCDEVLALEPHNAEAYIKKGAALEKLRREDEAVECYDRAIAADSSLTTAYLHKGGVFNRLERYQEALACYEQALRTEQKTLAS